MRAPNSIDFWRGFALVTIFINHVPGIVFERFTFRSVSLSDSAELFVFLAGFSLRFVVQSLAREPLSAVVFRLSNRAMTIYFAQIIITTFAIAIIASAATLLQQPYILQWHNAATVFDDPVEAHIGLVLLRYQLGYFNILPLYVVLMAAGPMIGVIDRLAPFALLPISAALYVAALTTGFNMPTWPVEGTWFFNPFSWQFIFILGFVISGPRGYRLLSDKTKNALFYLAIPIVLFGALVGLTGYSPEPSHVPTPKLFFLFDKTFLSPARLIHALALARVFAGAYASIEHWIPPLTRYLSRLGRNSLNVFCICSLLSLCGQIARYAFNGRLEIDFAVLIIGLVGMGATAWMSEWRQRLAKARLLRSA